MASARDAALQRSPAYRRDPFAVEPASRPMPVKTLAPEGQRLAPTVSRDMAELAAHLGQDPIFQDLLAILRKEALAKLTTSPLGASGQEARETARYELEALTAIETRIGSMAAEIRLHPERE